MGMFSLFCFVCHITDTTCKPMQLIYFDDQFVSVEICHPLVGHFLAVPGFFSSNLDFVRYLSPWTVYLAVGLLDGTCRTKWLKISPCYEP